MNHLNFHLESFTIRVYGILMDDEKGILISDEFEQGKYFTKFPGGGLELGEGITDCLIREWKEELGVLVEVLDHFYTTDFFQRSSFHSNKQLISVYYFVKVLEELKVKISDYAFDLPAGVNGSQSFRWISLKEFSDHLFTFEIDKVVARKLMGAFKS